MALTFAMARGRVAATIAKEIDFLDCQHSQLSLEGEARLEELKRLLSILDGSHPSDEYVHAQAQECQHSQAIGPKRNCKGMQLTVGIQDSCVREAMSGEPTPREALSSSCSSSTRAPSQQASHASTPTSSVHDCQAAHNGVLECVHSGSQPSKLISRAVRLFSAWHAKKKAIDADARHERAEFECDNKWALHYAARDGTACEVERLLSLRANPCCCDKSGVTPLHLSAEGGHTQVVEYLLAADASPLAATVGRRKSTSGITPLHASACAGSSAIVKLLLGARAAVDQPRGDDITALHFASQGGHIAVVWLLLERGADANVAGIGGFRPLHDAAHGGHEQVVVALLASRACASLATDDGTTPLHGAARCGHALIAQNLLESGASCNAKSVGGFLPLHDAAHAGHLGIVQQLLQARATFDARSDDDASALQLATRAGHKQVAGVLARGHLNVMRALRESRKNQCIL